LKRSHEHRERSWTASVRISAGCILTLVASGAFAQSPTPSPESVAETERVIVVGSHIPTAEEVGPNPVLEISREQIEKSGDRTTAELLQRLPIVGLPIVPTVNNGTGFTPGASAVALRGFNVSSTLVLLDGRRLAPYPLGGPPSGVASFIDLNSIPKAAIESIEILKDSASATYGADAVAGVVNIKFRRDYRGAEIFTSYGNTLDKDSGEETASAIFGAGDDRTNIVGVINYYHRNGIFERDRGFSQKPPPGQLSTSSSPINLQLSRTAVIAAGVPDDSLPHDADTGLPIANFFGHAPFFTNGDAPPTDYVYFPALRRRPPSSLYNFNLDAQAVPDSQRYGGFLTAEHKIFGEQLIGYGDFFYQNVDTRYVLAPIPTDIFQTPGSTTLAIPPNQPGPTIGGPSYTDTGVPLGAYNPFNPFQQIISEGSKARLVEFGDRIVENVTNAFFTTLGVKGDKLFDGNWGYDGGFRYSQVKNTGTLTGVSASRFNRVLNAADPIFDPASPEFIGTTVPYNPFGDYRHPIASNALPVDFASVTAKEVDVSKLATLDLNIYTISLFSLPAGGVSLAFGGQFRREALEENPDQLQIEGDLLGSAGRAFNVAVGRKAYAFYAETIIPIVSSVNPIPGVRALEFTAAARYEAFLNNNTNVLVPKVGMRWQPFDESLTVRATWGEGFQQPSLLELFANPQQALNTDNPKDPLTGMPAGEFRVITRGNPNLQPEDSHAFSGGIVYSPKFLPGLTLTVDLFDIESTGHAFIPTDDNVLDRSVNGQLLPLEKVTRDENLNIILLEKAYQNAGSRKARGFDLGLTYQVETRFGTFTSNTQATFLDSLQFAQTPNAPEIELVNSDLAGGAAALQWKATSAFDWTWRGISAGMTAYYLDGFHEQDFRGNIHYVSQTWLFDVRASYAFHWVAPSALTGAAAGDGKEMKSVVAAETTTRVLPRWQRFLDGTILTVGCNNVFGQDPPTANTGVNYPDNLYDPTGRFVYVSLRKEF